MINSTAAVPVVAISTLAALIYIGVGFLPRPSRAASLWSTGFGVCMVSAYGWIAADVLDSAHFRAASSGLMLGAVALMWSGVRAHRGSIRAYIPLAFTTMLAMPVVLMLTASTPVFGVVFRLVFTAAAVFAALIIVELLRLGTGVRDEVLPMVAASAMFLVVTGILIVNGFLVATGNISHADSLLFMRSMNLTGATVYIVCILVTTLLLTTHGGERAATSSRGAFAQQAADRLARAEAVNDPWWSVLDIRLDDPADIRAASSTAAFNAVSERFARDIEMALPAAADIEQLSPTRFLALVPRAQGGVREVLTDLLGRVSTIDQQQAVPIRLSASIGWAQVSAVGYDWENLTEAASAAAHTAHTSGGDRWERVRGTA